LTLAAAGCGGSPKAPSVANLGTTIATSTLAAPSSGSAQPGLTAGGPAVAFAACIRSHGDPTLPPSTPGNPFGSGVDQDSPQFEAAERKCATLIPDDAPPAQRPQKVGPLLAFVACMRKHGVPNLPDPNSQGHFSTGSLTQIGADANSPLFQSAVKTCQPLLDGESFPRVVNGSGH
jgi:hypothetical protein